MHVSNCLEVHKVLLCILRERMRSERVDLVVIAINEISPFFFLQVVLFFMHTLYCKLQHSTTAKELEEKIFSEREKREKVLYVKKPQALKSKKWKEWKT